MFIVTYTVPQARVRDEALQRAQLLAQTVDSLDEAVVVTDGDGKILLFSKGATTIFGVKPEVVRDKTFFWMLDDLIVDKHKQMLAAKTYLNDGKTRVVTAMVKRYDGSAFWGRVHLNGIQFKNGSYGFCVRIYELDKSVIMETPRYPMTPPVGPPE